MYTIIKPSLVSCAVAAAIVLCLLPCRANAQPLGPGDLFPDFRHFNSLETPGCEYLGVDPEADFHLSVLSHEFIVLEFLNVFCDMCREDVAIYNELYEVSLNDPKMAGTFAVLGVAVGNSFEEVMQFSDELFVRYPVLLDPDREILSLTKNTRGAPQTYLLQRQDDRYIIRHFSRSATESDEYLAIMRALSAKQPGSAPKASQFSYRFSVDGLQHTEKQFAGSRVLLYFPHERTYPNAADTRNTERQLQVFSRTLQHYPDIKIIMLEPQTTGKQRLKVINVPPGIQRAVADKALFDRLATADRPTVYYIDTNGNAVFKGPALTLSALRSMIDGNYRAEPDMSEDDIISLITRTLTAQDAGVLDTVKTELDGHAVYRTSTKVPEQFYYSRLESSPSLCDLCHDTHFVYSIDGRGRVVAFIPIALPKRGNAHWTADETAAFGEKFTGKNIHDTFMFNAKTDAVSGATITSSLVYEGFNRAKKIFKQMPLFPAGTCKPGERK